MGGNSASTLPFNYCSLSHQAWGTLEEQFKEFVLDYTQLQHDPNSLCFWPCVPEMLRQECVGGVVRNEAVSPGKPSWFGCSGMAQNWSRRGRATAVRLVCQAQCSPDGWLTDPQLQKFWERGWKGWIICMDHGGLRLRLWSPSLWVEMGLWVDSMEPAWDPLSLPLSPPPLLARALSLSK